MDQFLITSLVHLGKKGDNLLMLLVNSFLFQITFPTYILTKKETDVPRFIGPLYKIFFNRSLRINVVNNCSYKFIFRLQKFQLNLLVLISIKSNRNYFHSTMIVNLILKEDI